MRTELTNRMRAVLRSHPDGLTVMALADMVGGERKNVHKRLHTMPDTFIDRWEAVRGTYRAIWCIVTPPDHCPHPKRDMVAVRSRTWRDSREDEREADQARESAY